MAVCGPTLVAQAHPVTAASQGMLWYPRSRGPALGGGWGSVPQRLASRASLPLCCGCVRDWLRAPLPAGPFLCLPLGFLALWCRSASLPVTSSDVLVPQTLPWAAVTCVRAETASRRWLALHAG